MRVHLDPLARRGFASILNLGIGLSAFFINASLLAMHIAGGDGADFSPRKSQGKSDVQQPSHSGLPQGVKAGLSLAVFHVRSKHERHVEKDLLGDMCLRRLDTLGCFSFLLRAGKPVCEVVADDVCTYGSDLIVS